MLWRQAGTRHAASLPPLDRLSQVSMEPPGQQCLFGPGVGSGYAKDPYGEVHLKELIRLQITIYIYIYPHSTILNQRTSGLFLQ